MRWTRVVRPPHLLLISSFVLFFSSVGLCRVASSLSRACFLSITVLFVLFCAWLLLSPEPLGLIWNGRDHVTKRSEGLWEWPEETRVQGLEKVWWNLWCTFYDARALSDHSRITRHKVTCIEPSKKKNPCRKRERPVTERRTQTGSDIFAFLGCGCAQSLGKIDSEREKYHSNTTLLASRHNKREKASLLSPVWRTSLKNAFCN